MTTADAVQETHYNAKNDVTRRPEPERISIIYPTRDRAELLMRSLDALLQNTVLPDEIVVVDQSRTDGTRLAIAALDSPLVIYVPSTQTGLSRGRNTGIESSRFPIIGFIDDDCIPARTWIATARELIQHVPESGVWVGKAYDDEGEISDEALASRRGVSYSLKGINDPWRFGPAGGTSFFRRATFHRVGLFDPLLGQGSEFPGAEDGDMIYRIFKANLQVTYSDRIRVYHVNWRNDEEKIGNSYNYGLGFGAMVAKYVEQGDYYPATVIFGRRFLPNYLAVPCFLLLGRRNKFRDSLKWSQSMIRGFLGWRRRHCLKTRGDWSK